MSFFWTLIFMLLVFWRPQDWLMPWMFGVPVLDGVFFMALLSLLLEIDQNRIRFPRGMPQIYLLIGLWVAAVLSHVANFYFAGMMQTIPDMFKICFFTLLLMCVMDSPTKVRLAAAIFVSMACLMATHALLQQSRGYGFSGQRPLFIGPIGTAPAHHRSLFFGIFDDPNDLAQILATAIPFGFALCRRRSLSGFLLGAGIAVLLTRGVLATHSRGGMIALIAVYGVLLVLALPPRMMPALLVLALLSALVLCPMAAGYLDKSAHDRIIFWGMANQVFKQKPVFGMGHNMFWQVASDRAAHNAYVLCYTTIGLVGYWFWFGLIQLGVVGALRARSALAAAEDEESAWIRRFAGLSIAALYGFCASAYFLSRAFVYPLFFLMAMLGVLPWIVRRYLPADHPPLLSWKRDVLAMVTLGTVASVTYIYFSIVLLNKAFYG